MKQTVYRIFSAFVMLYWALAQLGGTGSYWQAAGAALVFCGAWWLGHESNRAAAAIGAHKEGG